MDSKRRLCIVTGSRAEWGLLSPVADALRASGAFLVDVVATGMHLSPEFGMTAASIQQDGYELAEKVEMLLSSDSGVGVAKSVGLGVIGFSDALARLSPDLVMVLGDRFEILSAVTAALFLRIPVAHLCGGDVTEGAFDDSIRHSITKMSHVHFPSNKDAARRIICMGERPDRVFVVGSPGVDHLLRLKLMGREALEMDLGFQFRPRNILATFHPETLADVSPVDQFAELLAAIETLGPEVGVIFTHPNADTQGRALLNMTEAFASSRENVLARSSLGQLRYLSVMNLCDAVVGNSSSGLYEAPSLKTPTVNIGGRQAGRPKAVSVVDCPAERTAIVSAVRKAFDLDCSDVVNPYGDGEASGRIVRVLREMQDWQSLLRKGFYEELEP
jgi:UDP-N-acetylglucosamine 2-epimerase (non-hydrolysing)/GDP/UDP-N,N'-diacetylbacillosamine 2-epimerase (hydrolysing)